MRSVTILCILSTLTRHFAATSPTPSNPFNCIQSMCRLIPAPSSGKTSQHSWNGWDKISTLIVFGASYAETGPDILNPQAPYKTSCNGPNYIDYLSSDSRQSLKRTKNYAIPGSPISTDTLKVLDPNYPETASLVSQVGSYLKDLKGGDLAGLDSKNALYHFEFGINDINDAGSTYARAEGAIFERYESILDKLYQSGARNFLVLDVPPMDRSPEATVNSKDKRELWKASVISFNAKVSDMVTRLGNKYTDATFFRLYTNELFSNVIDNPSSFPFTSVYKDTTKSCPAYSSTGSGTKDGSLPSKDYKSPYCPYAVDKYFWLQGYHPTYPVHHLMASEIAAGLEKL